MHLWGLQVNFVNQLLWNGQEIFACPPLQTSDKLLSIPLYFTWNDKWVNPMQPHHRNAFVPPKLVFTMFFILNCLRILFCSSVCDSNYFTLYSNNHTRPQKLYNMYVSFFGKPNFTPVIVTVQFSEELVFIAVVKPWKCSLLIISSMLTNSRSQLWIEISSTSMQLRNPRHRKTLGFLNYFMRLSLEFFVLFFLQILCSYQWFFCQTLFFYTWSWFNDFFTPCTLSKLTDLI